MTALFHFDAGNYSCIPGAAFSNGIIADPGFTLRRMRFLRPLPLASGFDAIEAHMRAVGRPMTAVAACELRSPTPMTPNEFRSFNSQYVTRLHAWGCRAGDVNPVGRSNVAPASNAPTEPSFFAFTYTTSQEADGRDFVISGKPENKDGVLGPEGITAYGDVSPSGVETKAVFVVEALKARAARLRADWAGITGVQVYTVHDIAHLVHPVFDRYKLSEVGITWYPSYPPVVGFEFEVDVRRVTNEGIL